MQTPTILRFAATGATVLTLTIAAAGCGLGDKSPLPLSGPSEFGLSLTLAASPDQLPRDGNSQSVVTITARDAAAQLLAGQRVVLSVSGTTASLSANEVVTAADGRASVTVTAPASTTTGNAIIVSATPVGTDAMNSAVRSLAIGLTGGSNATAPVPAFTITPSTAEVNRIITFDATATTDENQPCMNRCTYAWDFGDGTTGSGRQTAHTYTLARGYTVALTVTDPHGVSAVSRQDLVVTAPTAPTVTLAVVPSPPVVGQEATFRATATAAEGHSIVRYEWDFGDGDSKTTGDSSVKKTFTTRGVYAVTVRAVDTVGQVGIASLTLDLTSGTSTGISASFTVSPTNPAVGMSVNFNAATSTASTGATIVDYRWDWGDGTTTNTQSPTVTKTFTAARTYIVRLTIVDSLGRIAITTVTVTVALV